METRRPEICARTYAFAVRILRLSQALNRDATAKVIARQVLRSGTSIGANVEEAQGSHSRADFARRMNIARTEARETVYWLRLITDVGLLSRRQTAELLGEAEEILKILVRTMKTLRKGANAK